MDAVSRLTVGCVVTSWNYGMFIDEALTSLAGQTRSADEVVVADDCSTDSSVSRLKGWAHMPWRIAQRSERLGFVENANRAIAALGTDLAFVLSADDWLEPGFIEKHAAALENAEADVALAYCTMAYRCTEPGPRMDLDGHVIGFQRWSDAIMGGNFVNGSAMFRREVFLGIGGFPERDREEDHALWVEMARAGYRGVQVGGREVMLNYRQHGRGHRNYGDDERRRAT